MLSLSQKLSGAEGSSAEGEGSEDGADGSESWDGNGGEGGEDWGWGSDNDGSWGISWSWGNDGGSGVGDISDVSRVGIGNVVGDGLDATIGKSDTVLSVGGVAVAVLVGGEVDSVVLVVDCVAVVVGWGSVSVDWDWGWGISGGGSVGGGRGGGVLRGGSGHGDDGEQSNKALKGKLEKILIFQYFFDGTEEIAQISTLLLHSFSLFFTQFQK